MAEASFQLFLGGGQNFFNFSMPPDYWKIGKKQHFICSNLTLFIVPFFLFSFFSLFFLFFLFFFFFLFPWGGGATAPPAPLNDASDKWAFRTWTNRWTLSWRHATFISVPCDTCAPAWRPKQHERSRSDSILPGWTIAAPCCTAHQSRTSTSCSGFRTIWLVWSCEHPGDATPLHCCEICTGSPSISESDTKSPWWLTRHATQRNQVIFIPNCTTTFLLTRWDPAINIFWKNRNYPPPKPRGLSETRRQWSGTAYLWTLLVQPHPGVSKNCWKLNFLRLHLSAANLFFSVHQSRPPGWRFAR